MLVATAYMAARPAAAAAMATPRILRGVVFDMDGTLTVPVIDFPALYRAVLGDKHRPSSDRPVDILHEIEQWSPEEQQRAYATITEYEQESQNKLEFMAGVTELCEFIDGMKLKRGLITRNVKAAVDYFHSRFGMEKFSPALSREFRPYKPSAAPLLHICNVWGVSPSEVLMVGDSAKDDIVCGNRAGASTCLLDQDDRYILSKLPPIQHPTFKVHSLYEVRALLQERFDLRPPESRASYENDAGHLSRTASCTATMTSNPEDCTRKTNLDWRIFHMYEVYFYKRPRIGFIKRICRP